jgi:hypothetical protein
MQAQLLVTGYPFLADGAEFGLPVEHCRRFRVTFRRISCSNSCEILCPGLLALSRHSPKMQLMMQAAEMDQMSWS